MEARSYSFVLEGEPVALARARTSFTHKRIWDAQSELKVCRGFEISAQYNSNLFLRGPLALDVCFYFTPARTLSRRRKLALNGNYHIVRPDTDNLIKFLCDIATGILYKDDCIIASIYAKKLYDNDRARTEFTFTELCP
jgi:Holliday junction resolvase RusA-like endonuclease